VVNTATANDICKLVTSMSITVISCFEIEPRRSMRRAGDNKAFRQCISFADRDKLLNADKWPAFVSVSGCFFKPKDQTTDQSTDRGQQRQANQSRSSTMTSQEPTLALSRTTIAVPSEDEAGGDGVLGSHEGLEDDPEKTMVINCLAVASESDAANPAITISRDNSESDTNRSDGWVK